MNEKPEDFEPLLQIDKFALDEAIEKHPDVYHRISEAYALAISLRDEAKSNLADVEADVELTIRKHYEGKRVTEKEVAARVVTHKDVREAKERLHKLNRRVGRWSALDKGFVARGHALRELVNLYTNDYYASSGEVRSGGRMRDMQADVARRAMREARKNDSAFSTFNVKGKKR